MGTKAMETLRLRLRGSLLPSKAAVSGHKQPAEEDSAEKKRSDLKSSGVETTLPEAGLTKSSSEQFTHRRMSQPTKVISRFVVFETNNER